MASHSLRAILGKICLPSVNEDQWAAKQSYWNFIWKWPGRERIRTLLWLAAKGQLLSNEERMRCHMCIDMSCGRCGAPKESIIHILRDCWILKHVWFNFLPEAWSNSFFETDSNHWLLDNLSGRDNGAYWQCLFGVTCWRLWRVRNDELFGNHRPPIGCIVNDIISKVAEISNARVIARCINHNDG